MRRKKARNEVIILREKVMFIIIMRCLATKHKSKSSVFLILTLRDAVFVKMCNFLLHVMTLFDNVSVLLH